MADAIRYESVKDIPPDVLAKARAYLTQLTLLMNSPGWKATSFVGQELKLSAIDLQTVLKFSKVGAGPTQAGAFISAVMIQKAALAVGFATDNDYAQCAGAIGALATDLLGAAVVAPETLGIGSALLLVSAATDGYNVGQCVFKISGRIGNSISYAEH